ncbi:8-amino-7-oxononanoate synthase [Bacteroides fragilis]|uniref:8-amino-7-oxononanoate synthase n=1 Tax=Bacteroides fragilis TaxID=817 RepID=UPI00202DE4B5|nr:8-amino-7-oxononanoate synthase [Bacteroides fragilis]MCM0328658.1 8-amino-7-oxononanoate synthase [Bacteroides fragilis]
MNYNQETEGYESVRFFEELKLLKEQNNFRILPTLIHQGKEVIINGQRMLNLSSNDYLGLANDTVLLNAFWQTVKPEEVKFSSSSSRLLTGNFAAYGELEDLLSSLFGTEAALVFNCGYHANTGILPAICNTKTLILADKLVHASLIDGIRLSEAKYIRYRHNEYSQLEKLVETHHKQYEQVIIVTESIFSMDGDEADLPRLIKLKQKYPNILLYVDEAHAVGVRGAGGLGCAEAYGCIADIDFLVGTFGKALASAGAYVVCRQVIRDYLINKMRPFIFTTGLPPVTLQWTSFVLRHLAEYQEKREHLAAISKCLRVALREKGYSSTSVSQIVPMVAGESVTAIQIAKELQRKGFYALPVRPPTVPEGTSRIRFSLTADVTDEEVEKLISTINDNR